MVISGNGEKSIKNDKLEHKPKRKTFIYISCSSVPSLYADVINRTDSIIRKKENFIGVSTGSAAAIHIIGSIPIIESFVPNNFDIIPHIVPNIVPNNIDVTIR